MHRLRRPRAKGFTLIELLIAVMIIGVLSMIAIPNLMGAQRRSRYSRAAADAKTATTQAITYGLDKNVYPTSMKMIREVMLTNVSDTDPWGNPYQLSPTLTSGATPGEGDDVYIFSQGSNGTAAFPVPFVPNTGPAGAVGYSSVYGSFTGI